MDSGAVLAFVTSGGLLAIATVVFFAVKEMRAGKIAGKVGDLDSLRGVLAEQRKEMKDQSARYGNALDAQAKRYDTRITDLETDLHDANERDRRRDRTALALRRHLLELEVAMRAAGLPVPEWREPT